MEDDEQKPEMNMDSIAQAFKQLHNRLDRMDSSNTQTLKQMNDRNDSTMQSVHKALI